MFAEAPPVRAAKTEEGSHYYEYLPDAKAWAPLYEPGGTFTLREARKLKAAGRFVVPSVTTYFKCLHKQMLVDWKCEQVAKACYAHRMHDLWVDEEDYVDAMVAQANSNRTAADLGTAIHDAIESARGGKEYDAQYEKYVVPVLQKLNELELRTLGPEECLGSVELGYAGRCDDRCEGMVIVDFKSRRTKPKRKAATYSTDRMQLAAYGFAEWGEEFFERGRGYIFVISTTEEGRVEPVESSGADLRDAFDGFKGLMATWRYENKFDPRVS